MPHRTLLGVALLLCSGALLALPVDPAVAVPSAFGTLALDQDATGSVHRSASRIPTPTPTRVGTLTPMATPTGVPPPTPAPSTGGTFVKIYKNLVDGVEVDLTPYDVQVTLDGGSVLLANTQAPQNGVGLSWLVKTDAAGTPQWQEELGCFGTPPGDYADGVSVQQTSDGGYVVAGGTVGCGSAPVCPADFGYQCALVEKLDAGGKLAWSKVYLAGAGGSSITQIRQTTDGGYVAVGTTTDAAQNTGALILKLDAQGSVQWQRQVGPNASSYAYLYAVQQTSDGGFVAAGEFLVLGPGVPPTSVLVVKLDSSGNVQWQRGFNSLDNAGSVVGKEHALSVVQAADGGYAIGGNWVTSTFPGECCAGALLLKLASSGTLQWARAYTGGVDCFNQSCTDITGVVYSVRLAPDGGYVLAGEFNQLLSDSAPQVPWLAKVDSAGALLWSHLYYEVNPSTQRPLSQYFASSSLTSGGVLALGSTEDYSTLKNDLFGVKTDGAGLAGACSDVRNPPPISTIDPGLASLAPALAVQTTVSQSAQGSSTTLTTSINTQTKC